MNKLLTFLFVTFSYTLISQPVSFSFPDKNTLSIRNDASFTSVIEIYKGNRRISKLLIRPNSAKSIEISNYSKSLAKSLSYKAYYDLKAYNNDLQIIENTRTARIARKQREAEEMAWLTFFDQLITGGAVGKVISAIEFTELAMAGAPLDMWVERIGEELVAYGVGEIGDTRLEKAAVGAAYELSKGLQSSEFNDLNNHLENCLKRLSKSRDLTEKGKVINHTNQLPEKYNYPRVTLELGYPIQRSFNETKEEDFVGVEGTTFNDRYPFDISLSFDRGRGFSLFAEYSRTNTFLNTNTSELTSLKIGEGLSFTTYSLGVFPSLRSWGIGNTKHLNVELRLGGV